MPPPEPLGNGVTGILSGRLQITVAIRRTLLRHVLASSFSVLVQEYGSRHAAFTAAPGRFTTLLTEKRQRALGSAGYLEPAGALFYPPERHLHILKVHGLAEGEPDRALAVVGYNDIGARPPRFYVAADTVVSQRGHTA